MTVIIIKIRQDFQSLKDNKIFKAFMKVAIPLFLFVPYYLAQSFLMSKDIFLNASGILLGIIVLIYDVQHQKSNNTMSLRRKFAWVAIFLLIILVTNIGIGMISKMLNQHIIQSFNNQSLSPAFKQYKIQAVIMTVFLAPIFEETIFRRSIISFKSKRNFWITYCLSIVLFIYSHLLNTPIENLAYTSLYYIAPAICITSIYAITKDIRFSMFTHGLYNAIPALILLLQ